MAELVPFICGETAEGIRNINSIERHAIIMGSIPMATLASATSRAINATSTASSSASIAGMATGHANGTGALQTSSVQTAAEKISLTLSPM